MATEDRPQEAPIQSKTKGWRWVVMWLALVAVALYFILRGRQQGFDWTLFASTFLQLKWLWLVGSAALGVSASENPNASNFSSRFPMPIVWHQSRPWYSLHSRLPL